MKRVLVVNYSQTGQLSDITERVIAPLRAAGHDVHLETLVPETPFPFPWPIVDFFDAFPECVQLDAPPLRQLGIALHTVQDAKGRLPTEHGSHPSFYKPLLPYMEQAGAEDNRPIKEFLCPSRRGIVAGAKRDYGYAASNGGASAGASVLDHPDGVTLSEITNKNGTTNTLLLSHLWLDPQHYNGGDPTDLGWATKNNSRTINNSAKPDADATGSIQYIGGPHPNVCPSLFADAHAANMPYTFAQWAQAWAWTNTQPIQGLP